MDFGNPRTTSFFGARDALIDTSNFACANQTRMIKDGIGKISGGKTDKQINFSSKYLQPRMGRCSSGPSPTSSGLLGSNVAAVKGCRLRAGGPARLSHQVRRRKIYVIEV